MLALIHSLMIGALFITPSPGGGIIDHPTKPIKTQCIMMSRHIVHGKYVDVCVRRAPVTCDRNICIG